jgi:Secretion system C-terminal sorting domain
LAQNYGSLDIWVVKLAPPPQAIKVIATNPQLLIYPNPANSAAYIATKNIQEIRLIDALGRVYMHQKINNTNAAYTYLTLNYIANGTYMVQAIDTNGQVRVGKLMVVK